MRNNGLATLSTSTDIFPPECRRYCQVEPQNLFFAEDTPIEIWEEVVYRLKGIEKSITFWLGDAINFGERRYGEMYTQALEATDYTYGSLANIAWVARMVETSVRREDLPYSHHQVVAPLTAEQQKEVLAVAAEGSLNVRETRDYAEKVKERSAQQSNERYAEDNNLRIEVIDAPLVCPSCHAPETSWERNPYHHNDDDEF